MKQRVTPPLKKGERRQDTTTIAVYRSTATLLAEVADREEIASKAELVRWLAECAKAGLVDRYEPLPLDRTARLDKLSTILLSAWDDGETVNDAALQIEGMIESTGVVSANSEPFLKEADDLVTALRSGHMTQLDGLVAVERLAHRAALDALDDWTRQEQSDA